MLLVLGVVLSVVTSQRLLQPVAAAADALSFLLLGDWGKGGSSGLYGSSLDDDEFKAVLNKLNESAVQSVADNKDNKKTKTFYQVQVAKAMSDFASVSDPSPSFVVALGDNFYNNGVSSHADKLWDYLWKDIYLTYRSLQIPWFPVFGNHDYGGGPTYVQAQLDRTIEHVDDDWWQFPARNYSKRFAIPGSANATVQIIFVDTTTLAPSVNKCCNENGGVSKEEQSLRIQNQLEHIIAALEEAKADPPTWLLVAGHYPVFSAGSNGDTIELQQNLLPLLREYRVHAYLCGHDHISEHLRHKGVEFFVAGAGSMTDKLGAAGTAADELVWAGVGYSAFAYVHATAVSLKVGFVAANGTEMYSFTLNNPHRVVPPQPPLFPSIMSDEPASSLSLGLVLLGLVSGAAYVLASKSGFFSVDKSNTSMEEVSKAEVVVETGGYVPMLKRMSTAQSSLASMEEGEPDSSTSDKLSNQSTDISKPVCPEVEGDTYAPLHLSRGDVASEVFSQTDRSFTPLPAGSFLQQEMVVAEQPRAARPAAVLHRRAYTSFL
eukprot:gene34445-41691_t